MNYLVIGSEGPQMSSDEEAIQVLDKFVLPSFEVLMKFEKEEKNHGGLPVGERAVAFIMEAPNNEVVDQFIRRFPIWGIVKKWKVTPL
jgi:hypothetical protein